MIKYLKKYTHHVPASAEKESGEKERKNINNNKIKSL